MKALKLWAVLIFVLFFSIATFAQVAAGDKEVVASGVSEIVGGNTMAARQNAIQSACRSAVETGLGSLVESNTITQNFQMISDNIYSKAQGYVTHYDVVQEGVGDMPNTYKVTIKATVNMTQMGDDLRAMGILQDMMGMPMIMAIIEEQSSTGGSVRMVEEPYSGSTFQGLMKDKGFRLADKSQTQKIRSTEMARMDNLMESDDAIARIAKEAVKESGAQYLLVGLTKIQPLSSAGGAKSASATLNVKVVSASTGELVSVANTSATGTGPTWEVADQMAADRAAKDSWGDLSRRILQDWQTKANQGIPYMISVYGLTSYGRQARKFIQALKSIPGVVTCEERMWDAAIGRLEVEVMYKGGDSSSLKNGIFDVAYDVPGFDNFDYESGEGNNMKFRL